MHTEFKGCRILFIFYWREIERQRATDGGRQEYNGCIYCTHPGTCCFMHCFCFYSTVYMSLSWSQTESQLLLYNCRVSDWATLRLIPGKTIMTPCQQQNNCQPDNQSHRRKYRSFPCWPWSYTVCVWKRKITKMNLHNQRKYCIYSTMITRERFDSYVTVTGKRCGAKTKCEKQETEYFSVLAIIIICISCKEPVRGIFYYYIIL